MKNLRKGATEARKELANSLKGFMCEVLKCSEAEYAEVQYQEGLKYLKYYLPGDQHSADTLSRSRIFWNWWKNHWTTRDLRFKAIYLETPITNVEIARQLYVQYNNGKTLADSIHPNSAVLDESYAVMIKELIKEETMHE
jgi:hypothetical protein